MTLNDIIVSALAQLDRGHDAQTLDTWREKLTRFANEAVLDLSGGDQSYIEDCPVCCRPINFTLQTDGHEWMLDVHAENE